MEQTKDSLNILFISTKIFTAFPITLQSKSGNKEICFRWKSFRAAHAVTVILIMCFDAMISVYLGIEQGISSLQFGHTLIEFNGVLMMIFFFILAIQFPEIMRKWGELDEAMSCYGIVPKSFKLKLKFITPFLILIALTEQFLIMALIVARSDAFEINELIRSYVEQYYQSVLNTISYNVLTGAILILADINMMFAWYLADILIISMSVLLTARFYQISERIKLLLQHKMIHEFSWMQVRNDFNRLITFCQIIDGALGGIILLSISGNMFFLILLFQRSALIRGSVFNVLGTIFYANSICSHVFRLLTVIHFVGNVHSMGNSIIEQILLIPYDFSNQEIDRLALQVQTNQPALTGINCFIIQDSLLIHVKVFTAAVSYQLIAVQYELFKLNKNILP